MAERPAVKTKAVTRDKLAAILKDHELIKAFENITKDVSETLPDAARVDAEAIEAAQAAADAAQDAADLAAAAAAVAQLAANAAQASADAAQLTANAAGAAAATAQSDIDAHAADTANPHGTTATQVGLGNVDNTSDANKPVSTAQQTALDLKADLAGASFTGKIGYATGSSVGGTVAQAGSKSTGVTLDKVTGQITMDAAALAAATTVSFTLTNSTIADDDAIIVHRKSGGTATAYQVCCDSVAAGSCVVSVRNTTAGSLSEAVVLSFAVIKGAIS